MTSYKGAACNHELCNSEIPTDKLTTMQITFMLECLADQGILQRHGNDENGEPVYSFVEAVN